MPVTINLDDFFASIKAQLENIKGAIADAGFNGGVTSPGAENNGDGHEDDAVIEFDAASALVNGTGGHDTALSGNEFFNLIDAGAGNDVLIGGKGFDILLGGLGVDTADYSYMNGEAGGGDGTNGVFADLAGKFAVAGIQDVDILKSLENLIGSKHNDVLLGSEGGNVFLGNGGDDYIDGRGGVDVAQFHGQAEDYTVGILTHDNTPGGTPIGYTFTRDSTGDVTKVVGIEYVQFQNPSSGGIDFFAISGPGGVGSVIAEDDDYVVSEDSDSGVTLEPLDNDAILGAVAQEMLGLVNPSDTGGPLVFTVEGDYGTLTIDVLNDTVTYTTDDRADALQVGVDGTETFTYRVAGGDEATITITVTGANDMPVVSGPSFGPGDVLEVGDGGEIRSGIPLSEGTYGHGTGGSFTVQDVDSNFGGSEANAAELVTVSGPTVSFVPAEDGHTLPPGFVSQLNDFILDLEVDLDGSGAVLTVGYNFLVSDAQIEFLGKDDVLNLHYTITVADGDGGSVPRPVTITITGKNDGVDVTSTLVELDADESDGDSSAQDLSINGAIAVTDIDANDDLTLSVANGTAQLNGGVVPPEYAAQIAALLNGSNFAGGGTSNGGATTVPFTYTANDVDLDFLAADDQLVLSFTATVSDGNSSETVPVTVTITGTNDAPELDAIPDQTIDEEELVEATALEVQAIIDGLVNDPDAGDTHHVVLHIADGSNSGAGFTYDSSTDGDFSYQPPVDFAGALTVTVTAYDAADTASNVQTFTLNVENVNDAPELDAIPDQTIDEEELVEATAGEVQALIDSFVNDPDAPYGDTAYVILTLTDSNGPFTYDSRSGPFSYTPPVDFAGALTVTVTAYDAADTASNVQTFTLNVENVNDAPELDAIPDQTIDEEELVEATAGEVQALIDSFVNDPDAPYGDTAYVILTLTDSNGPFTYDSRSGPFSYTPPVDFAGALTVTVTAYDAADTASNVQTFTLNVENVNDAPELDAIPDQTIDEEELVEATAGEVQALIDSFVNDPDAPYGDTAYVILTLTDSNGPFTYDSRSGPFSYTPPVDFAGALTVTVTAYDAADTASNVQTFTLNVTNVNDAPELDAIPDQTIDEEELVEATAGEVQALIDSFVNDPDAPYGDTAYVILTLTDSNGPFTYDSRSGPFSYTPPVDFAGALTVTVTAYDAADTASNVQTFTLNVTNVNDDPVVTTAPGQNEGEVWEDGDLDNVTGATEAPDSKFEPNQNLDTEVAALLDANPDNMAAVVNGVVALLPPGGGAADAFAIIWDYVDDPYVEDWPNTYTSAELNEITARLGVEYAKYLLDGGKPLLDVYAKYTPDDGDGDTDPQRLQTLHDNLLGNLNGVGLADKLGTGSETYQEIIALLDAEDLSHLLARPWYGGYQGETNNSLAWDQDHGLVPTAFGQLSSSDVDDGATATWSGGATGTYGTFAIAADGAWTYILDNSLPATQGLKEGETVTETFVATVSDGLGGTASQNVVITIHGSNDAPFIQETSVLSGAVEEDGVVQEVSGQIDATDVDDDHVLSYAVVDGQGTYGDLTVDANGVWTYTLDNAAAQSLADGQTVPETFVVTVTDENGASDTVTVTVNVTGTNDEPVAVADVNSGSEDGAPIVGNVLTNDVEVDLGDTLNVSSVNQSVDLVGQPIAGLYGTLTLNANGSYEYVASDAAPGGGSVTDTFTYTVTDHHGGSDALFIDFESYDLGPIENGENGWTVLNPAYDQDVVANGGGQGWQLTRDVTSGSFGDHPFSPELGQSAGETGAPGRVTTFFEASWTMTPVALQTGTTGYIGVSMDDGSGARGNLLRLETDPVTGEWHLHAFDYDSDISDFVDQDLGVLQVGEATTIGFTQQFVDGADNDVWTVYVNGQAVYTGQGWEDYFRDEQPGISPVTYDRLLFRASGPEVVGDQGVIIDNVSYTTNQQATLTITVDGSNDAADITGDVSGTVDEDSGLPSTVSGDLNHTDVDADNDDDVWEAVTTATLSASGYGTYTMTADGVWTYTLNDAHPDVDALEDNETLPDSFTVYTEDGTAQVVTITITGTNDAPVIAQIAQTDRDEQTDASDLTANIVVNFTDAELLDTGHTATITGVSVLNGGDIGPNNLAGLKALVTPGVPSVSSGTGTVTLAFVAASTVFDHLAAGEILELEYTLKITDGGGDSDAQTFVVKITGTNDAPTISDLTGTFGEDDLDDLVTGINLLTLGGANDVDGDDVTIVADGDLNGVVDGINADLDVHLEGFLGFGGIDFSLPVEALIQTGLMSLDPDGTLTMDQSLADALQVLLDNGDTVNVNGTLTVTDVHGALAEADIDITLNGSNGVPDDLPIYGHGAEPDFLVPTFDHDGDLNT